jgi:hypothetical protein
MTYLRKKTVRTGIARHNYEKGNLNGMEVLYSSNTMKKKAKN